MGALLGNALAMLAARLAPPVFSFAINVAVARLLGADSLGAYVYLLSLLMIFQAVAGAGMPLLVTREIAARPGDSLALVRDARNVGLATGLLATLGFVAWARGAADPRAAQAALLLAPSLLPSAWIAVQEAYFVARHEHHAVTVIALVENAVKLSLAAAAFAWDGGLVALCAGISAARLAGLATGQVLMARRGCRGTWRPDLRGAWPMARALPPFGALMVTAMVFFRVDVLVIGALRDEHDTGLYGAALTLYTVALLLPDSAMSAVYPRLAASFQRESDGFARATVLTAKLLASALVPVSLVLIVAARPLIGLIYGAGYLGAAPALALLAASLPVHAVNAALGQALQAGGQQAAVLGVALVGTAVHVGLTLALVSAIGVPGAPIAVLISSTLVALASGWLFHRRIARLEVAPARLVGASAVAGPVGLVLLAPQGWALAAAAAGLAWLAAALLAERLFARTELDDVARVLLAPRVEAGAMGEVNA